MKKLFRQYIEIVFVALLLAFFVRFFFVAAYRVTSLNMEPNLKMGDFVLASKWSTGWRIPWDKQKILRSVWPERGEVVIFECPGAKGVNCVKRLIGLPGDRVEILKGKLVVNGKKARYSKVNRVQFGALALKETHEQDSRIVQARVGKESLEKVDEYGPIVVPPGHFFVLSDDRRDGIDSREWGAVPKSSLIGVASLIWLSLDWQRPILGGVFPGVRTERLFQWVH
ncbi:MAG: signal peptidase I [Bdellovibrionales bacterium]|nr:signal peptidase I [Bdellovibrionales bacterium]